MLVDLDVAARPQQRPQQRVHLHALLCGHELDRHAGPRGGPKGPVFTLRIVERQREALRAVDAEHRVRGARAAAEGAEERARRSDHLLADLDLRRVLGTGNRARQ